MGAEIINMNEVTHMENRIKKIKSKMDSQWGETSHYIAWRDWVLDMLEQELTETIPRSKLMEIIGEDEKVEHWSDSGSVAGRNN